MNWPQLDEQPLSRRPNLGRFIKLGRFICQREASDDQGLAHERDVASMDLLELRRALGSKPNRTTEEEDFIVSSKNIVEELRDEGRKEGRDEGRLTQARVSLRRVLAVRTLAPSPTDEARIDACTDIATLERWHDQALIAQSAAEALHSIERTQGQRRRAARSS